MIDVIWPLQQIIPVRTSLYERYFKIQLVGHVFHTVFEVNLHVNELDGFLKVDYLSPVKLCQTNKLKRREKVTKSVFYFCIIIAKVFFMIQHFVSIRKHLIC